MPAAPLLGRHSAALKQFRQALRLGLLETGDGFLLALEGPKLIDEALRAGVRVERVLFSQTGAEQHGPSLRPQLSKHAEVLVADNATFSGVVQVEQPQGVAALARWTPARLESAFGPPAQTPLLLAGAGLQDPGNLGTLVRAADAFGATGVITLDNTVSPFNPKAIRASAGSLFHLPIVAHVSLADLLAACAARNVRLIATAARGKQALAEVDLRAPICLAVGQEGGGVPRELLRAADATVAIPMARAVDSLNAGVAGSILLYEAARRRADRPLTVEA